MKLIWHLEIIIYINKFADLVPRSLLLPKRVERVDPELVSPGFFCSRSNCMKEYTRAVLKTSKCINVWPTLSLQHPHPIPVLVLPFHLPLLSFSIPFFSHNHTISTLLLSLLHAINFNILTLTDSNILLSACFIGHSSVPYTITD